jgi:hypothetical protein
MIELTGVSLKLDDKRVDKKLEKEGYEQSNIFYSPIKSWLFGISLIALQSLVLHGGIFYLLYIFPFYTTFYLLCAYLIAAYMNNSFAIHGNKLLVVNRNFPFYKFKVYEFEDINTLRINNSLILRLPLLFVGIFGSNYVEIRTNEKTERFYCIGLDIDCYDENWTEKNLDDFHYALQSSVNVIFSLD